MKLLVSLCLAAAPAAGQDYGAPGPHPVGWRDTSFEHPSGTIYARVYYPALAPDQDAAPDTASGPYPLHGFMHGWGRTPEDYDVVCSHLAGWGWVVASVLTDPFVGPQTKALDLQALLHWTEEQSSSAGHWLQDLLCPGCDWSVSGHSLGGAAAQYLVGAEPRVRTLVAFQGIFSGSGTPLAHLAAFDGSVYYLAGDADQVALWDDQGLGYFHAASSARRTAFALVPGMDHGGPLDELAATASHGVNRSVLAAFCASEQKGDENAWYDVAGGGLEADVLSSRTRCSDSSLWAIENPTAPGQLVIGQAAEPGELVFQWVSLAPAPFPIATVFGDFGLDPLAFFPLLDATLGTDGWLEFSIESLPELSGLTLWVQGLAGDASGAAFTRTAQLALP